MNATAATMANPFARILVQLVVSGVGILAKGFMGAYAKGAAGMHIVCVVGSDAMLVNSVVPMQVAAAQQRQPVFVEALWKCVKPSKSSTSQLANSPLPKKC